MTTLPILSTEAFLGRFFESPNKLSRDSKPEIANWIARIARSEPMATVLPCWRDSGVVDWYGLAFDDRQFRALGEWLTAFVGPSYSNFSGQVARLNPSDPIELAVHEFTHGRAFRFQGIEPKAIWATLERLRQVAEHTGYREHSAPAPVGRVLRDFHMAIRAGLEDDAKSTLDTLRDQYHLDGLNVLFLQVELYASFNRWQALLDFPELPDLIRLRKPVAVTEALLRAVYQCHLLQYEEKSDAEGALQHFAAEVFPRFGALTANRSGMRSPEAAKMFMLVAANQPVGGATNREDLLEGWTLTESDQEYLLRIADFVGTSEEPQIDDPLQCAYEATRSGDYDRAFTLTRALSPSLAQARLLCECAFELDTIEVRAAAIAAVNCLSDCDRQEFLGGRINNRLWQGLQDVGATQDGEPPNATNDSLPTDWTSWVDYLNMHDGGRGAREIAHRGATEWSLSDLLSQPDGTAMLTATLGDLRSQSAERALQDSLPHLLAFFQRDDKWPNPAFREIYRLLFERLYVSTEGSRSDLIVFSELLECLLSVGVNGASEYKEIITCASDLCQRFTVPSTFDHSLDLIGVLVHEPCLDADARLNLFDIVLHGFQRLSRHIRDDQRGLLRLLANDLGVPERVDMFIPRPEVTLTAQSNPHSALSRMSIALYSLTERAIRQVQNILEDAYPGVRVTLCSDMVGTPRLKQLARQSDIFVVATASAKHAATEFIAANRPKDRPILRPQGKGAASMLAAIAEHFAKHM